MFRYAYARTLIVAQQFDKAKAELARACDDLVRVLGADHPRVRKATELLAQLERDPIAARSTAMQKAH